MECADKACGLILDLPRHLALKLVLPANEGVLHVHHPLLQTTMLDLWDYHLLKQLH